MASRDLVNNISTAQTLAPATYTASVSGVGVDLKGFESAAIIIGTGTITDGTHTVEVQESDDNSTFAAVADANLQGVEPVVGASDDNKIYEIGYLGAKRYIRVNVTVSGATSGGAYYAVVVRGHSRTRPI